MRVTEQGQITIPKLLRDRFGLDCGAEVEITATEDGVLIRKCDPIADRLDRVTGILDGFDLPGVPPNDVDAYIEEIRGR